MEEVYLYGGHSYSESSENMDMVTSPNYGTFPTPAAGLEEIAFGSCVSGIPDADWMEVSGAVRAKIASHSLYPKLLQAHIDCQKVGAPPEVAKMLDEIGGEGDSTHDVCKRTAAVVSPSLGVDPELDQFMETYCDILRKLKSDLSRPFDEAMVFLDSMRTQLSHLCHGGATETCTSVLGD